MHLITRYGWCCFLCWTLVGGPLPSPLSDSTTVTTTLSSSSSVCVQALSMPYGRINRNIATQILQGTGPSQVDLNQYNLPLETIEQEWTANFVQSAARQEAGVYLRAQSPEYYVDTIRVSIPRREGVGLGLILTELAGGRSDGLGITIVSDIVKDGPAEGVNILPGDCISEIGLMRQTTTTSSSGNSPTLSETTETMRVRTECLSYDATVDAIQQLPGYSKDYQDTYVLQLKRLRRKPKVSVKLQFPPGQEQNDRVVTLFAGENLRYGMLLRDIAVNDPQAHRFDTKTSGNCGAGGLCRTCAVAVVQGADLLDPKRPAETTMFADNPRWRLACKTIVGYGMQQGNVTVRVYPGQW
jgi:ferredoxin